MQLPGYLRDRALREWCLLNPSEQQSYQSAIEALRIRLDPGSKTVAAQEFRHSLQRDGESVSDFIRRLEKKYQVAYGRDDLNSATRDALLYGQLYEGLRYDIMLSTSVSGSQGHRELATAAKAEERRLAALKQRQHYTRSANQAVTSGSHYTKPPDSRTQEPETGAGLPPKIDSRRCNNCGQTGHFANKCPRPRQESTGRPVSAARTKQVHSRCRPHNTSDSTQDTPPESFLFSSSDEESSSRVNAICITDKGSSAQCVMVLVQGVMALSTAERILPSSEVYSSREWRRSQG